MKSLIIPKSLKSPWMSRPWWRRLINIITPMLPPSSMTSIWSAATHSNTIPNTETKVIAARRITWSGFHHTLDCLQIERSGIELACSRTWLMQSLNRSWIPTLNYAAMKLLNPEKEEMRILSSLLREELKQRLKSACQVTSVVWQFSLCLFANQTICINTPLHTQQIFFHSYIIDIIIK